MASTTTERHNFEIKTTTETTIRLQERPASTGNSKTAEKEVTGLLTVGRINERRNMMTSTTYYWDTHSVEKYREITMKNILKND